MPDISVAAVQFVAVYKGLMLAETVAHTDGQTLRILKYRFNHRLSLIVRHTRRTAPATMGI